LRLVAEYFGLAWPFCFLKSTRMDNALYWNFFFFFCDWIKIEKECTSVGFLFCDVHFVFFFAIYNPYLQPETLTTFQCDLDLRRSYVRMSFPMDSTHPETELNDMLKHLNAILYEDNLSEERKNEYLQLLRDVLHKVDQKENPVPIIQSDYAVLQITCDSKSMAGKFLQPPTTEMIQIAVNNRNPGMFILASCIETNFLDDFSATSLQMFVKFRTVADAKAMTGVKISHKHFIFQFSVPSRSCAIRAVYRTIGGLVTELRQIDACLKKIGALPGNAGMPYLPQTLVEAEVFDRSVQTLNEHMQIRNQDELNRLGYHTMHDPKRRCYEYLTYNTKVNKTERELKLQSLLDSRMAVMYKLKSYNQDEFPFTYDIAYKG
jgi:hypothetical protein